MTTYGTQPGELMCVYIEVTSYTFDLQLQNFEVLWVDSYSVWEISLYISSWNTIFKEFLNLDRWSLFRMGKLVHCKPYQMNEIG